MNVSPTNEAMTTPRIAILTLLLALTLGSRADERPNILWISCEDISPHLRCFGDAQAITPHLDALATEGVRYPNTFTTAGVCAPCRSGIITGLYQTTLGTHHMRCQATLPDHIQPFPTYLREAGYFCTNNAKEDYQFKTPKDTWDHSNKKAHWRLNPDLKKPFFAVFNFGGCHESGIAEDAKYREVTKDLSPEQRQDPNKLVLPPYYPDTPIVREDWKRNYELITAMDAWAGDLIQQLKDDGLYEKTIIFYWSDHGVGLPRAKRWLYDSGTRVPLIARVPKSMQINGLRDAGAIDDQLISSLDFAPTMLHLAGLPIPKVMQGRAFLGKDLSAQRDYVYGARDRMDERYDIIRAVRDKRFRYIRNYEPHKAYYQYMNTPEKGATMKEIRRVASAGSLPAAAALFTAAHKPAEELYDLEEDPHEIHNLVEETNMQMHLERLRKAHLTWVEETRDLGLLPESEIVAREGKLGHRYAILRQPDGLALMRQLRDTANHAANPADHQNALMEAMNHSDPGIRYWAAMGLGNHAASKHTLDPEAMGKLASQLGDPSPAARVAAGRALCHAGQPDKALPVLVSTLEGKAQWARLQAAIVLDEIDALAFPWIPHLQRCLEDQPNKYITRVANRALNELLGTAHAVR
jgi:arylsulfatase A-like enzyme